MADNSFGMAAKSALSKLNSLKCYLMKVLGMTEAEADAKIAEISQ